ncbi:MAG TPA: L,D-transpeptidase family protein [Syntrophales bacterium]|nr:L,D-transpeptidase family protein [Syntrophales bacterium]
MDKEHSRRGGHFCFLFACIMIAPILMCGCSHFYASPEFKEANDFSSQGNYKASLSRYEQIIARYPTEGDRVLFEMGFIYAFPRNQQKDYQKALECFQKLIKDYPGSGYRHDSEVMISLIDDAIRKDKRITTQQGRIEVFEQEVKSKDNEIIAQQKQIEELESKALTISADKVLIEKKERRLTLISSKEKVLKTYKIALGGNPLGPKEKQGDKKTPEGTYVIDSRNKNSPYHLSLHISYPNEKDKKRAEELGVVPGGDIMIHGIKNGLGWVDRFHTQFDWTEGCIAVTDEEIEEIDRLVPDGTVVEIRP